MPSRYAPACPFVRSYRTDRQSPLSWRSPRAGTGSARSEASASRRLLQHPEAFYQYHENCGCPIQNCRKIRQHMIIYHRNHQRHNNTGHTNHCLTLKIVHVISEINFCHISARAVQHDQPKAGQKHNDCHQTEIIIIGLFSSFYFASIHRRKKRPFWLSCLFHCIT